MDKDEELARLEAAVYSRAGSTEAMVDFTDPVTGETRRATPSQLRLRALQARQAGQAGQAGQAAGPGRDRFARVPDAADAQSLSMPALLPRPYRPRHRRFMLPRVAFVAFVAGILTGLIVTSVLTPSAAPGAPVASARSGPLLVFDDPTRYPDIPVPDLGDQFVADSLRNISGTSPSEHGFGVYLGREAGSGLYCLIVYPDQGVTASSCGTEDGVTQRGLSVRSEVTVRSPVSYGAGLGANEAQAALSTRGDFSLFLSLIEPSVEPPTTTGATLGTWTSEPDTNGDFQAELDANGDGLIIALDCLGEGTVTVVLSENDKSVFECRPDRGVESFMDMSDSAHGRFNVSTFTTGSVAWGLTIASTPVG